MPILDSLLTGALGAGLSGIAGLFSGGQQKSATKYAADLNYKAVQDTNQTNLALAREQNDWNERMWHETNAYNSPEQQLQRLREAGINPNSVFNSGTAMTASTAPQSANLANQVPPSLGDPSTYGAAMAAPFERMVQALQLTKMQAEIDKIHREGRKIDADTKLSQQEYDKRAQQIPYETVTMMNESLNSFNVENEGRAKAASAQAQAQIDKSNANYQSTFNEQQKQTNALTQQQLQTTIQSIAGQLVLAYNRDGREALMNGEQIQKLRAEVKNIIANTERTQIDSKLAKLGYDWSVRLGIPPEAVSAYITLLMSNSTVTQQIEDTFSSQTGQTLGLSAGMTLGLSESAFGSTSSFGLHGDTSSTSSSLNSKGGKRFTSRQIFDPFAFYGSLSVSEGISSGTIKHTSTPNPAPRKVVKSKRVAKAKVKRAFRPISQVEAREKYGFWR